ncbi:MAG: tryptophan--tRNA ligase [Candidatus Marinimicrobia bacterium]|nr:tryptophan--tRNA ligase [Candidatus Neomarinimicrobiota bacterium]
MRRILSGIQPSGQLHLGNYFGMMSRMIDYQENNDLFCFIVNYHALTTMQDGKLLQENTFNAACDFIALGLDPEITTFWVQSDVPQVTELTWLLANITSVGLLERSTSYKDKIAHGITPNMGLFTYPILMAADILLFGGEIVPVGKDQKQHLEITRDIAIRFNNIYGNIFVVPEPDINKTTQLVPGIDGQKMSKSYGNSIPIFASEKYIRKQVMSIVTDSTPIDESKSIDTTLFQLYSLFLNEAEREELADRFRTPGLRYGDVKKELFNRIMDLFTPFREKRVELEKNRGDVIAILRKGADKAAAVAEQYLKRAREVVGVNYC